MVGPLRAEFTGRDGGAEGRRPEGRRGGSRRVTRRAEGGGTEITEAGADGDVGVPGIFLFPLYRSLVSGRRILTQRREGAGDRRGGTEIGEG